MTRNPNPPPIPPHRGSVGPRRPPSLATPGLPPRIPAATPVADTRDIIAHPGRYYRITRFIIVALLIGCAGWLAFDGWHTYPADNQHRQELQKQSNRLQELQEQARRAGDSDNVQKRKDEIGKINEELHRITPRTALEILMQKVLAFASPLLAAFMLWWTLHNSRGVYRLSGDTLHVPGHPPVKLNLITKLDKTQWDRKGVAFVEYRTDMAEGRLRLDDFIYQRDPTDAIYKKIDDYFTARASS